MVNYCTLIFSTGLQKFHFSTSHDRNLSHARLSSAFRGSAYLPIEHGKHRKQRAAFLMAYTVRLSHLLMKVVIFPNAMAPEGLNVGMSQPAINQVHCGSPREVGKSIE